jgi:DNA-directed RNA polymerase subunit beta'
MARSASAATTRTSAASSSSRRKTLEPVEYLIPKGKPFHLQDGDAIEKGDYILDGNPAPHDILAIKGGGSGFLPRQRNPGSLPLQGVLINDKHIEVIVRQMLQKVEITEQGDRPTSPATMSTDRAR